MHRHRDLPRDVIVFTDNLLGSPDVFQADVAAALVCAWILDPHVSADAPVIVALESVYGRTAHFRIQAALPPIYKYQIPRLSNGSTAPPNPSNSSNTPDWKFAMTTNNPTHPAVTPAVLEDLRALLDYTVIGEERDYEESDPEARENHILLSIRRLDASLADTAYCSDLPKNRILTGQTWRANVTDPCESISM